MSNKELELLELKSEMTLMNQYLSLYNLHFNFQDFSNLHTSNRLNIEKSIELINKAIEILNERKNDLIKESQHK